MGPSRLQEEDGRNITWNLFKELEKYFPRKTRKEKEREFDTLKQGNMSVGEYIRKFESLIRYFEFYQV